MNKPKNSKSPIIFAKYHFTISFLVLIFSLGHYINKSYNISKNEEFSKLLINNYDISLLYVKDSNTIPINISNGYSSYIIGVLNIDKLNLRYPILSDSTDESLQIAPCRFYGPMPNEIRQSLYCWSQL